MKTAAQTYALSASSHLWFTDFLASGGTFVHHLLDWLCSNINTIFLSGISHFWFSESLLRWAPDEETKHGTEKKMSPLCPT